MANQAGAVYGVNPPIGRRLHTGGARHLAAGWIAAAGGLLWRGVAGAG